MRLGKPWVCALLLLAAACNSAGRDDADEQRASLTAAQCEHFELNGKVQICHATGSSKHPYTILKLNEQACVNAHASHAGDYVAVGDPTCQGGGCLPVDAPCDATLPCCDGLSCTDGVCQGPPPVCPETGGQVCSVPNTVLTCASGNACDHPVCAAGFANCDRRSPDCETPISATGGCFPRYLGTYAAPTQYQVTAAAVGADGSNYLLGGFAQTTDFDPGPGVDARSPQGPNDVYLVKLDPNGAYLWTRTFGGPLSSTTALTMRSSGNAVVIAGLFTDPVDFDPGPDTLVKSSPNHTFSSFVVSLTLDGQLNWASTFEYDCFVRGLAIDGVGDTYVAGGYSGLCDLDPGPAVDFASPASFDYNAFLVKLNRTDGSRLWSTTNPGTSEFSAAAVAADGSVWVAGRLGSSALISSFGTTGVPSAHLELFGMTAASATGIDFAPDGSIYVAGTGFGSVDFDPGPADAWRVLLGNDTNGSFVLKLGADGTFRWVQTVPQLNPSGIAALSDGGAVITGYDSYNTTGAFVAKLESDSTPAWSFRVDGIVIPHSIAGDASTFAFSGGADDGAVDYDPGPGVDSISGSVTFLSRFAY